MMRRSEEVKEYEVRDDEYWGKVEYWRYNKEGEGVGSRRVGNKVKVKVIEKVVDDLIVREIKENEYEGVIELVVKRKKSWFNDYWYRVKLNNGKSIWVNNVFKKFKYKYIYEGKVVSRKDFYKLGLSRYEVNI